MSETDTVFFDFIEVGTSDFDTLIQAANDSDRGISIEPIPIYLDRLPDRPACIKLNAAISDRDGECQVYYVEPDTLNRLGLPYGLRGCNSIDAMHPTVAQVLGNRGLDAAEIVTVKTIRVLRLVSALMEFRSSGVYLLKVDAEGHDTVILEDFFRSAPRALWPYRLQFESNILSDNNALQLLVASLIRRGYDLTSFGEDADLRLNLRRARSSGLFSSEIPGYYLAGYPEGFNPHTGPMPYDNTLEAAQRYCMERDCCGVTFQDERYEVRGGWYLLKNPPHMRPSSWVRL